MHHLPHWFRYEAEVEGSPASIHCDLARMDREKRPPDATTALLLNCQLVHPTRTGLGSPEEQTAIRMASKRIREALEVPNPPASLVADCTMGGTWQATLYMPPRLDEGLIPTLKTIVEETVECEAWIQAERDPTWNHYQSLLPPTHLRLEATNQRALDSLSKATTDLSIPRTLTHTLTFPSREAAELALSSLRLLNFELEAPPRTHEDHHTKLKVSRRDPPHHIPALTLMLSELSAPLDGDHLEWTATT